MIRISLSYCNSLISRHGIIIRSNDFKLKTFGTNNIKNTRQTHNQNLNPPTLTSKSVRNYVISLAVITLGLTYAAVPLYRIFCQNTGYGGTVQHDIGGDKIEKMKKNYRRRIRVKFNSDVVTNMQWKFKPQQNEIVVMPGETALAFYTATNPTDEPVIGVSTYNILPHIAAPYFNKIQCFCFEEQLLNPKEQVDMPVFFYIDPEYCEDPKLENINEVILSYTFFEAKKGTPLQLPEFFRK